MAAEPTLWSAPAYLPYLQPPLTPQIVAEAERHLGVTLPPIYLEMLQSQNGGYLRLELPNAPSQMLWGIGPHFPSILDAFEWRMSAANSDYGWAPDGANLLIPFDGDGHWHLCFDYRSDGPRHEPKIAYVDLEGQQEEQVARDFETFLTLLRLPDANTTLGINSEVHEVIATLEEELGVSFQSMGWLDHGYEIKRAGLGSDGRAPWIWLSENNAPRGFVRPADPRYEELKGLLPGTALRFPEHTHARAIIECNGSASSAVERACEDSGLQFELIQRSSRP